MKSNLIKSLLLVCVYGCMGGSSGGGGSPGTTSTAGQARLVNIINNGNDSYQIEYEISNSSEPVSIEVDYSEDLGNTFQEVSDVYGEELVFRSNISSNLTWNAYKDLGQIAQGDIVLRLTPYGQNSGNKGSSATSSPFSYRTNTAPEILSCQVNSSPSGSPVSVSLAAKDQEKDTVSISAEYSLDGGSTFNSIGISSPDTLFLQLSDESTLFTIKLDARATLGENSFSNVIARITIQESTESDSEITNTFNLNTYKPAVSGTTVENIPQSMNGSTPFTNLSSLLENFRLMVPSSKFSFQVTFDKDSQGYDIDHNSFNFSANKALGPGGEIAAGSNLAPLFQWSGDKATLEIGNTLELFAGTVEFSSSVADQLGNESSTAKYNVTVESPGQAARPFSSSDLWSLTFNRDYWSITSSCDNDTVTIDLDFSANERPDFLEDLSLLGLYNFDKTELSDKSAEYIKERIIANLRSLYQIEEDGTHTADSPKIRFTLNEESGSSFIASGGADPGGGYTLGRAYFDRCNKNRESNVAADLGIFTTNLIRFYINISYTFKHLFNPFISGRGTPIGDMQEDETILSDDFVYGAPGNTVAENERFDDFQKAAEGLGKAIAGIMAHEIGHSIGLVANGPPPEGLFGGEKNASFAGYWTDPYHIDTSGNNIMESSMSFSETQYTGTYAIKFNKLNMAYLLERVLLEK